MLLALRLVGFICGGLAGAQLGLWLSGGIQSPDIVLIFVLITSGGALGAVLAPFFTIYPVRALRAEIERRTATELLAASVGFGAGLALAALLALPLSFLPPPYAQFLPIVSATVLAYLGVTIMLSHQDVFLRFAGRDQGRPVSARVLIVDTSVIIDGRIADVSRTGFLEGELIVPRFVLDELQLVADSSDVLKRNRGRRGLDMLTRLQRDATTPVRIIEQSAEGAVDAALIRLAREVQGTLLTNDYNLHRVAEIQGVRVLNLNDLAAAVRAVVLPGEELQVRILQEGREPGQGVAYLDDGTMVVVDQGRRVLGSERRVVVTRVLQTVGGRLVFATLREEAASPAVAAGATAPDGERR